MLISKMSLQEILEVQSALNTELQGSPTLEDAARKFVKAVYEGYKDSIVLFRLFITLPFAVLPRELQDFVSKLASGANVPVTPNSHVLTLFGTIGAKPAWSRRQDSKGHQGIPLATPDFVSAIPMMSALLEQLGFDLGWIRGDPEIVARKMGSLGGTFYVPDASSSKDSKGRLIIAAQDFVKEYGVRTVFGVGGGYTAGGHFMTSICFLREPIPRETAVFFQRLVTTFKLHTQALLADPSHHFE